MRVTKKKLIISLRCNHCKEPINEEVAESALWRDTSTKELVYDAWCGKCKKVTEVVLYANG